MKARPGFLALVSVMVFAVVLGACSPRISASPTPPAIPRVGLMHVGPDHNPPSLATLVAGLGDLGWLDGSASQVTLQLSGDGTMVEGRMKQLQGQYQGQRIELIWRNLEGKAQAEDQAAEYVREH